MGHSHHNEAALPCDLKQDQFAMTFDEIGKVLGLRRGTVWTIYHRAMRKLRAYPGILAMLRECATELDAHRQSMERD